MIELKPCPACGCTNLRFEIGTRRVICGNANCQFTGPKEKTHVDTVAAWNDLPRRLCWTKEPPAEPGWYWYRDKYRPRQVVYVFYGDEDKCMFVQFLEPHETPWNLSNMSGEWAAIQEPVE